MNLGLSTGSSSSSTRRLPPIHRVTDRWKGTLQDAASRASISKRHDWLTSQGFRKGLDDSPDELGWTMSEEVVRKTHESLRYLNAKNLLLVRIEDKKIPFMKM